MYNDRIYVIFAQILAGLAAIGTIFSDGQVSVNRIIVGCVAFVAMLASIMVAVNASVESDRMHQHLETLLRSMDLPYFIVRHVSDEISEITRLHGWLLEWQENFKNETVYHFKKIDNNVHGSLIVSDAEFKELWILGSKIRNSRLQVFIFGGMAVGGESEKIMSDRLSYTIRFFIYDCVSGSRFVDLSCCPDETWVFNVKRPGSSHGEAVFRLTKERRNALLAMTPIEMNAVIESEVKSSVAKAFAQQSGISFE